MSRSHWGLCRRFDRSPITIEGAPWKERLIDRYCPNKRPLRILHSSNKPRRYHFCIHPNHCRSIRGRSTEWLPMDRFHTGERSGTYRYCREGRNSCTCPYRMNRNKRRQRNGRTRRLSRPYKVLRLPIYTLHFRHNTHEAPDIDHGLRIRAWVRTSRRRCRSCTLHHMRIRNKRLSSKRLSSNRSCYRIHLRCWLGRCLRHRMTPEQCSRESQRDLPRILAPANRCPRCLGCCRPCRFENNSYRNKNHRYRSRKRNSYGRHTAFPQELPHRTHRNRRH